MPQIYIPMWTIKRALTLTGELKNGKKYSINCALSVCGVWKWGTMRQTFIMLYFHCLVDHAFMNVKVSICKVWGWKKELQSERQIYPTWNFMKNAKYVDLGLCLYVFMYVCVCTFDALQLRHFVDHISSYVYYLVFVNGDENTL